IHVVPKSPRIKSGANDLAGFIEAPVIGAAQSPARAIYPPTAIAPLVPMLRAPEAVPRRPRSANPDPFPSRSFSEPEYRQRVRLNGARHGLTAIEVYALRVSQGGGAPLFAWGAARHNAPGTMCAHPTPASRYTGGILGGPWRPRTGKFG